MATKVTKKKGSTAAVEENGAPAADEVKEKIEDTPPMVDEEIDEEIEAIDVDEDEDEVDDEPVLKAEKPSGNGTLLDLAVLKEMSISDLTHVAKDYNIQGASGMRKQELIFKVLAAQTEKSGLIFSEG